MELHVAGAVLFTVSVEVCAAPLIATEAGKRLHLAGSLAAVGERSQLRLTVPVKPLTGVTVIMEVFPVVAPGVTVTAVPLTVKPGILTISFKAFEVLAENSAVPW
jgi:hypothetical protein